MSTWHPQDLLIQVRTVLSDGLRVGQDLKIGQLELETCAEYAAGRCPESISDEQERQIMRDAIARHVRIRIEDASHALGNHLARVLIP